MDNVRLSELRARFGDTSGVHANPRFIEVAAATARLEATSASKPGSGYGQPVSGIPSLLDAPAVAIDDRLDVALFGVPLDLGVTNRPGARFGPRAIRTMERIGPYNHVLDVVPFDVLQCGDVGDVPFGSRYDLETCLADVETFVAEIVAAGAKPLAAGGDHSVTYPILKSVGAEGPVGLIHIDAHCDTEGAMEGTKFHHGAPFRNAVLDGVLDPERAVQIGIRGSTEFVWEFSYESGMTVIHAEDVTGRGVDDVIAEARAVIGEGPVYVSIDVDGIDPAFTPGTGTPEVGGLTPREVQAILRGLATADVVGGDVVEVAPQYDPSTNTAQVAAQMLFEILSMMAVS
ncbi:MAG: agmatinase [Acidimicrobiales bacterium]